MYRKSKSSHIGLIASCLTFGLLLGLGFNIYASRLREQHCLEQKGTWKKEGGYCTETKYQSSNTNDQNASTAQFSADDYQPKGSVLSEFKDQAPTKEQQKDLEEQNNQLIKDVVSQITAATILVPEKDKLATTTLSGGKAVTPGGVSVSAIQMLGIQKLTDGKDVFVEISTTESKQQPVHHLALFFYNAESKLLFKEMKSLGSETVFKSIDIAETAETNYTVTLNYTDKSGAILKKEFKLNDHKFVD